MARAKAIVAGPRGGAGVDPGRGPEGRRDLARRVARGSTARTRRGPSSRRPTRSWPGCGRAAGGQDLAVAEANLARSKAEVESLNILMDRMTVRAPRDGTVLRRQIEPGEYAASDPARPALIIGDLSDLNIRAQVDEEDIGLVTAEGKAVAQLRRGGGGVCA